jgi:hypothetical protein
MHLILNGQKIARQLKTAMAQISDSLIFHWFLHYEIVGHYFTNL